MSEQTTTATTTHTLLKYSKSFGANDQASDWQHFTNPVIKSVADVQKSAKGDFTAFRLRIIWLMSKGSNSMDTDSQEVVFEDLDMLSFSLLLSSHVQTSHAHGLPLKAVYRENTVGIRYLHPLIVQQNASPSFRRFQLTFESSEAATQFVDVIKDVCPCKLHEPARSSTMRAPTARTQTRAPPPIVPAAARSPSSIVPPEIHVSPRPSSPPQPSSSSQPFMSAPQSPASSMPMPPSSSSNSLRISAFPGSSPPISSPLNLSSSPKPSAPSAYAPPRPSPLTSQAITGALFHGAALTSSPVPSSQSSLSSMPPPPVPLRKSLEVVPTKTPGSVADALQHLCKLPRAEMEKLVGEIVHEESFLELVNSELL
ncbi:hypothetical protein HWV62_28850 [Athelia sp. TMB]|nr:hypothetical protein HWV62_28850 [Athelia sp. TMB]